MIAVKGNTFTYFDCDDTLVMWRWPSDGVETWIELDPWNDGTVTKLAVNTEMVEQLKRHKARHSVVVVWSAGGADWAETVVKALGIEKYVDITMAKPTWSYDDKQPEDFMPRSQWLGRKEWLK